MCEAVALGEAPPCPAGCPGAQPLLEEVTGSKSNRDQCGLGSGAGPFSRLPNPFLTYSLQSLSKSYWLLLQNSSESNHFSHLCCPLPRLSHLPVCLVSGD